MEQLHFSDYSEQKQSGAFFTPDPVVRTLVKWAVRSKTDRMLDPSCGDGRFIACHARSVGIEQNLSAASAAMQAAPGSLVHEGDFFSWALHTKERFECATGNPPFIRYQSFKGEMRSNAAQACARVGVSFSGLASSWAPFLVAAASLLKPGGRIAFVVPAEIGHAPYARPLLEFLISNFGHVRVVAIREKLFQLLSEDCWLLFAEQFGESTSQIEITFQDRFKYTPVLPKTFTTISVEELRNDWNFRLRPFLLPPAIRSLYRMANDDPGTFRLGEVARIGIGYVSGANDFFHLRPSSAEKWKIPETFLRPTVRNSRVLQNPKLGKRDVQNWLSADEPVLLLNLPKDSRFPIAVSRYLDSQEGQTARHAFKCRSRTPWYSVPDVRTPTFFLSYMSGEYPSLVRNEARCTCTNSLHAVQLTKQEYAVEVERSWKSLFTQLSCEIEGHPLGGGMLKLEVREAANILMGADSLLTSSCARSLEDGLETLRGWRHHGNC